MSGKDYVHELYITEVKDATDLLNELDALAVDYVPKCKHQLRVMESVCDVWD